MDRRKFIYDSALFSAGLSSGFLYKTPTEKLTILHTNDMHSRIEPFPMDGGRNQGLGGVAKRAALIKQIRQSTEQVLLLDSGDIFQGTPYFNVFGGELEFKVMSEMNYDLATMGNHDFDAGIDGFVKQLPHANFEFVSANYKVDGTALEPHIKPYKIIQKGQLKIGIFGLGIELDGLVPESLCKGVRYLDPITIAQQYANILKKEENCDLVICLSHLGYKYRNTKPSDVLLAQNTNGIDIILGGHTHTFLSEPDIRRNNVGDEVIINQVGWGGMILGRLDLTLERNKNNKCVLCKNSLVY